MLLIFIVVFLVLLYFYFKLKYFTLRGSLPGIPPHFLFGNLIQLGIFRGEALPHIFKNLKERFGECYQLWIGPWRFIVVSNIVDVEHIFTHRNIYDQGDMYCEQFSVIFPGGLICIKGSEFKRHAAVTLPLFRRAKIISNFDLIVDSVDKLLSNWHEKSKDYLHTDIVQQSQNLLLQIFGLIAFDYDLETLNENNEKNELTQALNDLLGVLQFVFSATEKFVSSLLET